MKFQNLISLKRTLHKEPTLEEYSAAYGIDFSDDPEPASPSPAEPQATSAETIVPPTPENNEQIKTHSGRKGLLIVAMAAFLLVGAFFFFKINDSITQNSAIAEPQEVSSEAALSSHDEADKSELDISEEVELVMYVIGDRPAGQDIVDENMNKLFKDKLNCTLKINWISWAEYYGKYPLLFYSGEAFDMAIAATWLNFSTMARDGVFMALDDLWPKYAPENYAMQSEASLTQATIDGNLFCVPGLFPAYTDYGVVYRNDLVEGDREWGDRTTISSFEDIELYGDIVWKYYPDIKPLSPGLSKGFDFLYMMNQGYYYVDTVHPYVWFDSKEENPKVFSFANSDVIMSYLEMAQRWSEKGLWSTSTPSYDFDTEFNNGLSALTVNNVDGYNGLVLNHQYGDVKYNNLCADVGHQPFTSECMVIPSASRNPERALALWNLITTKQEAFDAFYYGVEGTSYELDDKGDFCILDPNQYSTSPMWAARSNELNRNPIGSAEDYDSIRQAMEESIVPGKGTERFSAFEFDRTPVQSELWECDDVIEDYWRPLEMGLVDLESGYKDFCDKMKAAGIEKVIDEMQRQLDEYVANH